jgi:hypothetical protein
MRDKYIAMATASLTRHPDYAGVKEALTRQFREFLAGHKKARHHQVGGAQWLLEEPCVYSIYKKLEAHLGDAHHNVKEYKEARVTGRQSLKSVYEKSLRTQGNPLGWRIGCALAWQRNVQQGLIPPPDQDGEYSSPGAALAHDYRAELKRQQQANY